MSKDINHIVIIGRLTKDPEIKYSASGTMIASFSVAVNDMQNKDKEGYVNFFDVTFFGKTAELIQKYTKKGDRICIDGQLRQNRWQGKDGNQMSRVGIIGNSIQFLESKKDGQSQSAKKSTRQNVQETFDTDPWVDDQGEDGDMSF